MTRAIARDPIYRRRRFQSETIELCVRWYLTYRLSYRDLVEMMAERGVTLSHSTILRWVQRYVPEFERRLGRYARPVHSSWRMDETAVSVRGGAHYLYRAVDKHGKTVDSLLCTDRSESAARAFFNKALMTHQPRWPRKLNLDGQSQGIALVTTRKSPVAERRGPQPPVPGREHEVRHRRSLFAVRSKSSRLGFRATLSRSRAALPASAHHQR
jgi:transposase-like protein